MRRKSNNLYQGVLPLDFQKQDQWPTGYHKGLLKLKVLRDGIYGFDIETIGLEPYDKRVEVISYAISPEKGSAGGRILLAKRKGKSFKRLKAILENPRNIVVGHNLKFDCIWAKVHLGIDVKAMLFDTLFAQYLLDENRISNKLDDLVDEYLPEMGDYKARINRSKLLQMNRDDLLLYNLKDADAARRLFDVFIPKLEKQKLLPINNTGMEVLPILTKMESRGVYLDREWAKREQFKLFESAIELRQEINDLIGYSINPSSSRDLQKLLYTRLKFPVEVRTKHNQPAVDKKAFAYALKYLRDSKTRKLNIGRTVQDDNDVYGQATEEDKTERILRAILSYKGATKQLSTYYHPIPEWLAYDARVHSTYRLGKQNTDEGFGGTVTGRLSSDNPNLQQITIGSSTRGMFAATRGYIWFEGDFGQLELRVAAELAKEKLMIKAFSEGLDIHSSVMSDITGIAYDEIQERKENDEKIKHLRVAIKRVNFGILYGVQAQRLKDLLWIELGIDWTLEECEKLINQWLAKFRSVYTWLQATKQSTISMGYSYMPFGQRRRLPEASFYTTEGRRALRQAINFPIQSTASWICLIGMILLDRWITSNNLNAHLLMQVHDSIALEVANPKLNLKGQATFCEGIASNISRVMERDTLEYIHEVFGIKWSVPLKFEVKWGERWK